MSAFCFLADLHHLCALPKTPVLSAGSEVKKTSPSCNSFCDTEAKKFHTDEIKPAQKQSQGKSSEV